MKYSLLLLLHMHARAPLVSCIVSLLVPLGNPIKLA